MDRQSNGVVTEPPTVAHQKSILLIYHSVEATGPTVVCGDHWALRDVVGYQSDDNWSFYTNEMHIAILDDIGNDVHIWGRNLNSTENKINTLVALFGGNSAARGQEFRAVIHLKCPL